MTVTVKLVVNEVDYDLFDALGAAPLGDLIKLKRHNGATVRSMKAMFTRLDEISERDGFDPLDYLSDDDLLCDFVGLIYLTRRHAGEDITPVDAENVSWQDFHLSFDDDAPAEAGESTTPKEGAAGESPTTT